MTEHDPHQRRFWNSKQAANYLNVTVQTLYAYCHGPKNGTAKLIGQPPPFRRLGRNCVRFPIVEFKQWAETWDQPGAKSDV